MYVSGGRGCRQFSDWSAADGGMREEEVAEGERKKQIKTEWTEEVKEEEEKLRPSADEG